MSRASHLQDKLGVPFLQMHNNFGPKDFDRVKAFVKNWHYDIPLAIEFRKTDWYNDAKISSPGCSFVICRRFQKTGTFPTGSGGTLSGFRRHVPENNNR